MGTNDRNIKYQEEVIMDMDKLKQDIQNFIKSTPKEEIYKILGITEKQPDKPTDFLVNYEMAQSLKSLGFNLPCLFGDIYGDGILYATELTDNGKFDFELNKLNPIINSEYEYLEMTIPSYEQVFKWLRDKGYETIIHYKYLPEVGCKIGYVYEIIYENQFLKQDGVYEDYEEAREAAIKSIINHISSK